MAGRAQFEQYCKDNGFDISVVELNKSTRTAQLAAEAIGTELGSIVKSLVFLADGKPTLVLVAGDRRADTKKLAQVLKAEKVKIADADTVRAETGFAIGGVPPVGHHAPLPTIIDRSLGRFETVYAAAGSPHAVFPIAYDMLLQISAGQVVDVTED
jgi:Cys-tRNA(Pro) deacylase